MKYPVNVTRDFPKILPEPHFTSPHPREDLHFQDLAGGSDEYLATGGRRPDPGYTAYPPGTGLAHREEGEPK